MVRAKHKRTKAKRSKTAAPTDEEVASAAAFSNAAAATTQANANELQHILVLCLGIKKVVAEFADLPEIRANDDPLVQQTLRDFDYLVQQFDRVVNEGIMPDAEEVLRVYDRSVAEFMKHVGHDLGNCGQRLDGKQFWIWLNFGVQATRERRDGQTEGDRMCMDNETFVLARRVSLALN